ncbi:MAG TPA: hypothetical protein VIR15_10740 [Intrasporangium sp.]
MVARLSRLSDGGPPRADRPQVPQVTQVIVRLGTGSVCCLGRDKSSGQEHGHGPELRAVEW